MARDRRRLRPGRRRPRRRARGRGRAPRRQARERLPHPHRREGPRLRHRVHRPVRARPAPRHPRLRRPELLAGAAPTPAADLYSLGVLLGEASGGRAGTEGPGVLRDIVCRCLDERPGARPSAAEAAVELGRIGEVPVTASADARPAPYGPPVAPPPVGPPVAPPPVAEVRTPTRVLDEPLPPPPPPRRRAPVSRRPWAIAGVVLAGLAAVAVLAAAFSPDGERRERPGRAAPADAPSRSRPAASGVECAVSYRVDGSWPQGFQATVRITNLGDRPIEGWRLGWTFPDGRRVTDLWNGGREQDGRNVTVTDAGWNRVVPPDGTVEFGFVGAQDGDSAGPRPRRFTLNGGACRAP
ncbi:hypothetical protein GEV43_29270 [Actinomadura sp. J1-007]|nr:hypothetical protein [Actinomadura sp. J1-007]